MSKKIGSDNTSAAWMRMVPDVVLTIAAFMVVLAVAPMSEGYAFPASPPPELIELSKGALSPAMDACQSAWLSFTSLAGSSPSYFTASLGPNLTGLPSFDRNTSIVLAAAISGMVAMNLAVARHFHSIISATRE